jgi:hypothetical protein
MKAKKNSAIGNEPFSEKRKVFRTSGYMLTQDVGKKTQWRTKEIEARQKKLVAIETWPLSA